MFLAIIADGAVRKWLLPSSQQAFPYFAKDVLAVLFVLRYPTPKEARWAKRLTPFVLGIALFLAPAFVLGLTKVPVGAVVVFKNAVLWPLFAIRMGSYLTEGVIDRLCRLALASSIFMAGLGVAQYFAGGSSMLNRYAWDDITLLGNIAMVGNVVRATGTFSYISGLASFSIVMFCLFLGRGLAGRGREFWLAIAGVASAVVCGLVTGSRGVEVFMMVVATAVLVFVPKKHGVRLIGGMLAAGVVSALLWNSSLSQGVIERWNDTFEGEVSGRLTGSTTGQPIWETLSANPVGLGLGLYTGISAYAGRTADLAYNESAPNRVAAEAGFPGYMAGLLSLGLILRAGRRTLAADPRLKNRVLPIVIGALIQVAIGLWYDHAATALWWWVIALWLGDGIAVSEAKRILLRPTRQLEMALVRQA